MMIFHQLKKLKTKKMPFYHNQNGNVTDKSMEDIKTFISVFYLSFGQTFYVLPRKITSCNNLSS